MIRLSAGTAAVMGLSGNRMDVFPTTAYLLSGTSCTMKCSFCPQGFGRDEALNRLGRITWPEYPWEEMKKGLLLAQSRGVKRVCLQSVRHRDGIDTLLKNIADIKDLSSLPLSLSAWLKNEEEAAALVRAGVDRISVSLDVVNPEAHARIKGGSLDDRLSLLLRCADRLPGKMSTHIICGLGESEKEVIDLINILVENDITIALFAFVPLRGTPLADTDPPALDSYRRIQAGHYLLKEKKIDYPSISFFNQRLVSYGLTDGELEKYLEDGKAFQTSGCPDCNRPYYNERPGGVIYNYHRSLNTVEMMEAYDCLKSSLSTEAGV